MFSPFRSENYFIDYKPKLSMPLEKTKNNIRKTTAKNWYYWGRWNQVMLFTAPWAEFSKTSIFKKLGINNLKGDLKILHGNYYFLNSDLEKICKKTITALDKNFKWFTDFFKICNNRTNKLLSLEGKQDIMTFVEAMIQVMGCSALVEMTDMCIERYLKKLCEKEKIEYAKVAAQVRPPRPTLLMLYQNDLKSITATNIDSFVKKYKWVGTHALEGKALQKKDVLKTKTESAKIFSRPEHLPKKFLHIIKIASELSFYRSNLMETINKVAFGYRQSFISAGKKHGLSYQNIISLTYNELKLLLKNNSVPPDLKIRDKNFGIVFSNNSLSVLLDQKLKQELKKHEVKTNKDINKIIGTPASKGVAKGTAKILTEVEHAKKIKQGDILIAHETTPDYIVAMNKAVAFVTDIGGLTCHAAITAREMNKPCIIGTKNATKILKDNDLVEVDANKGIVKILKRSKE